MIRNPVRQGVRSAIVQVLTVFALILGTLQVSAYAQAPALLPSKDTVAPAEPLAIDGVWMVRGLQKQVRIERGRIYALEPWVHAFIFQIQPGMVTARDIRQQSAGVYAGSELSLTAPVTYRIQRDGSLQATTASLIPAVFQFDPLQLDYAGVYALEYQAATGADAEAFLERLY